MQLPRRRGVGSEGGRGEGAICAREIQVPWQGKAGKGRGGHRETAGTQIRNPSPTPPLTSMATLVRLRSPPEMPRRSPSEPITVSAALRRERRERGGGGERAWLLHKECGHLRWGAP